MSSNYLTDKRDLILLSDPVALGAAFKIATVSTPGSMGEVEARRLSGLTPVAWRRHGTDALRIAQSLAAA